MLRTKFQHKDSGKGLGVFVDQKYQISDIIMVDGVFHWIVISWIEENGDIISVPYKPDVVDENFNNGTWVKI